MTRESFIKKWLGNLDKKYTPEFKDEMRDDLDKLSQSQQIDIQTLNTGHLIEFGMYLSGHDVETVMQIYQDWNNGL